MNRLLLVAHHAAPFVAALLLLLHMDTEVFKYDERERRRAKVSTCMVEHWQHWGTMKIVEEDIGDAVIPKHGLWTWLHAAC